MNKLVKISSLALVALLASCGKNSATPLKKIDGKTAENVAYSICDNRFIEFDKLVLKEKGVSNNKLFVNNSSDPSGLFPYSKRRMSADITITNTYLNPLNFTSTVPTVTTIKKHTFFDMDQLYYHCHTSMTRTLDYETISYSDFDTYYFFIEDEKQDEDVVETEYDKTGTYYFLVNYGNLSKIMRYHDNDTKAGFTRYLVNEGLFTNDSPIVTQTTRGFNTLSFNDAAALSNDLISVTPHLAILDNYDANADFEDDVARATTPLLMDGWLEDDFVDVISDLTNFRDAMKEINNDKTYFNFALRSNDARSLGVDTDFSYCEDGESEGDTLKGITTFTTSFTIRDLYLTESHFNITSDTELESQSFGNASHCYFSTKLDQNINYNPSDKIEIPSDYLEYPEAY